jgi:hypothetical protein
MDIGWIIAAGFDLCLGADTTAPPREQAALSISCNGLSSLRRLSRCGAPELEQLVPRLLDFEQGLKLLIKAVKHLSGDVHGMRGVSCFFNALQSFHGELQKSLHYADASLGGLDAVSVPYRSCSHFPVTSLLSVGSYVTAPCAAHVTGP